MANPEHVAVVKKGAAAIEEWRQNHPGEDLDLSEADFPRTHLAALNLSHANLKKANLTGADLTFTNLTGADLSETNLTNTNLQGVNFQSAYLHKADLTHAWVGLTVFIDCDLSNCIGLETTNHAGPIHIDIWTLVDSFTRAGNQFTPKMEEFFLDALVPRQFLKALPEIMTRIHYYSCFICYGQPDLRFAERLVKDLKTKGVSCWLYSMDYTPGERTWKEVGIKRRETEKMIVLCSVKSLIRNAVLKEIEEQIDEEPDKIVPISLDDTWKEIGFLVRRGQRDLKPFLLERNYADFSDESNYEASLNRLLKGIKRNKT